MLSEKKTLYRFLIIYIVSTLLLLFIGGYFYYKLSHSKIIENSISLNIKQISKFIKENQKFFKLTQQNFPKDINISIYVDKKHTLGNFEIKKLYLNKEFWIDDNKVYYRHQAIKRWGHIDYISFVDIKGKLSSLKVDLSIFFIFAFFSIVLIAYFLGKMFLKPMKQTIVQLEEFIADATHEINTPISNISTNIELIEILNNDCKNSEEFNKIKSSAFRISKVFKDLSFATLNHNYDRKIELLELDKIVVDRIEFFSTSINKKNIKLKTKILPLTIKADKEDMTRIIDNIISNSVKHTKIGGNIKIILDKYFEVINDGNIKDTKKIFQKFTKENSVQGGFGLGLYMVKKIVDFYRFNIDIKSINNKVLVKIIF